MLGCDPSLTNCASYQGNLYVCDGSLQQSNPSYVCNCRTQISNAPTSSGDFSFAGVVPTAGGCGLPVNDAAVSNSTSTTTIVATVQAASSSASANSNGVIALSSRLPVTGSSTQLAESATSSSVASVAFGDTSSSEGLSRGAKAGVGAGVGSFVLLLFIGLIAWRRWTTRKADVRDERDMVDTQQNNPVHGEVGVQSEFTATDRGDSVDDYKGFA